MLANIFHLLSWKWLLLGSSAGFIRNPNHLAAFCPEPSLQLLIICYVSWFCPFLIVKVTAANSFHLRWYCCIDGCRGSFFWSLQNKQQKTNSGEVQDFCFAIGSYQWQLVSLVFQHNLKLVMMRMPSIKPAEYRFIFAIALFCYSLNPQNRYMKTGLFFQDLVRCSTQNYWVFTVRANKTQKQTQILKSKCNYSFFSRKKRPVLCLKKMNTVLYAQYVHYNSVTWAKYGKNHNSNLSFASSIQAGR